MDKRILTTALFSISASFAIACTQVSQSATSPTPFPVSTSIQEQIASPVPSQYPRDERQSRRREYSENVNGYKEINPKTWYDYNQGLPVTDETRVLEGRNLSPNRVILQKDDNVDIEYIELKDVDTSNLYWIEWDRETDDLSVDSYEELKPKIEDPQVSSIIIDSIGEDEDPVPKIEEFLDTKNPYATDLAVKGAMENMYVFDIDSGKLSSFLEYKIGITEENDPAFDITLLPETLAASYVLSHFGIPDTAAVLIADEVIDNPDQTRLTFSFVYEDGEIKLTNVGVNDSRLVRFSKNTYAFISSDEGKEFVGREIEGRKADLLNYAHQTWTDSQEAGEQILEDAKEAGEEKAKQIEGDLHEKSQEVREDLERRGEEVKEQIEEQKRKAGESLDRAREDVKERVDKTIKDLNKLFDKDE